MNRQHTNFGPWTTSLDSGSRMQLSAFWKHRMRRLPGLASATRMPRRTLAMALVLAVAVGLLPLVELVPAAPLDATKQGDFVATFSNGVSVELIGLSKNPSAEAPWWKPDGTPLEERPYHRVMARMGSTDSIARELCWLLMEPMCKRAGERNLPTMARAVAMPRMIKAITSQN